MEEACAVFRGRVQGVGFRARTADLMRDSGLSGYVQNLTDGTVRVVLQGTKPELDAALVRLRQHLQRFIQSEDVVFRQPTAQLVGFRVRPTEVA